MDLAGVLLGRRRPTDDRLEDDERRLGRLGLGGLDRAVQLLDVLGVLAGLLPVDVLDVPTQRLVAGGDVLGERDVGVVLDRDLVRVVEDDQATELLAAGEARGLVGDALLHVAVTGDHVGEVVEGGLAVGGLRVEQATLEALRVAEAHGGGEALAERAGRDLDTVGVAVLRVTRGLRAPLAEVLEVLELEAVAVQVELHVLQDRGVARREDEAVAADPGGVAGVATHHLLEEQVGDRREAHRGAGVTVAGGLDRVGGEDARRVDGLLVDGVPGEFSHLDVDPSLLRHVRGLVPSHGHDRRPGAVCRVAVERRPTGSSRPTSSGHTMREGVSSIVTTLSEGVQVTTVPCRAAGPVGEAGHPRGASMA